MGQKVTVIFKMTVTWFAARCGPVLSEAKDLRDRAALLYSPDSFSGVGQLAVQLPGSKLLDSRVLNQPGRDCAISLFAASAVIHE
jgi:hypothetical protein